MIVLGLEYLPGAVLATDGFALLAPLVHPMPKQPDLLREVLETLAAIRQGDQEVAIGRE